MWIWVYEQKRGRHYRIWTIANVHEINTGNLMVRVPHSIIIRHIHLFSVTFRISPSTCVACPLGSSISPWYGLGGKLGGEWRSCFKLPIWNLIPKNVCLWNAVDKLPCKFKFRQCYHIAYWRPNHQIFLTANISGYTVAILYLAST